MKRPPQLWMISVGILCLSLLHTTYCLRATSLIFSKTTTTTTTTTTTEASTANEAVSPVTETSTNETVVTRPPLTGIPQIDYKYDPNLPSELNGYNLSDYPFYSRVPPQDEIDFKCDGLHDGFYASIVYKCQVYHHCLYGTRFDFLCANFTAFDQRTFICQFASEVDCDNSKNFWHRNDALYIALSTVPPVTKPPPAVITASPQSLPGLRRPIAALGGGAGRRRPYRRRRPQYDYYYDDEEYESERERDDYYDDPPRSAGRRRKQRPRTTSRRPETEEYDDYEDERFDRRGTRGREESRDRSKYDRRGEEDRRYDDRRPASKNEDEDRRPTETERRRPSDDRRRPSDDRRKANDDDLNRRPYERPRKPLRDAYEDDDKEDRRAYDRPRKTEEVKTDRRPSERPRKEDDDRRYRPKEVKPVEEEKIDRRSNRPRKEDDDRRYRPKEVEVEEKTERRSNRPNRKPLDDDTDRSKDAKIEERTEDRIRPEEPKVIIRPSSGSSVYDRPRAAPIIRRPVPKTERDKFDYKPVVSTKPPRKEIIEDEEYYDDYEDEPKLAPPPKQSRKPVRVDSGNINHGIRAAYSRPRQSQIQSRRPVEEVEEERRPGKRRPESERIGSGSKNPRVVEEYEDEYEEDKSSKENSNERTKVESREAPAKVERDRVEPVVRVVKRPFLPSRGGNPYSARGLQPVGNKALEANIEDDQEVKSNLESNEATTKAAETNRRQPLREIKVSEEDAVYEDEIEEDFKPLTSRPRGDFRYRNDLPRTTQRSKVPDPVRNPLDINENEYDVTLNDALNPTIPNLPVRSVPTGFSSGRDAFTSQNYQRPRLGIDSAVLSPAGSDFVYQIKPRDTPTGQASRYNPYVAVQQLNYRHPSTGAQYYTSFQ